MIVLEFGISEPTFRVETCRVGPQGAVAVGCQVVDDYAVAAGDVVAVEGGAAGRDEAGETDGDGGVESVKEKVVSFVIDGRKRKRKKKYLIASLITASRSLFACKPAIVIRSGPPGVSGLYLSRISFVKVAIHAGFLSK